MKLKPFFMAAACSIVIFSSCKKDDTPLPAPDPVPSVTAISPSPDQKTQ